MVIADKMNCNNLEDLDADIEELEEVLKEIPDENKILFGRHK